MASSRTTHLLPRQPQHERFALSRQLFISLLCVVYFAAFASFGVQADGLIGENGILPASALLERAGAELHSAEKYWQLPTLLWLGSSDAAIRGLCIAGALGSLLPMAGVAPRLVLLLLWSLYLSLVSVGGIFFSYQWDALLLEAGLSSLFFAPRGWLPSRTRRAPVSKAGLWLLRWLLLRVMLLSGLVKLLSGDETWRDGTALAFHYLTQPLPTWTSYYAHQLPALLHALGTAATLAIEIGAPLLIFGPRRARGLAFVLLAGLQLAIAATGNYGFFNLLTLCLCVTLLGDDVLLRAVPQALRAGVRRRYSDSPEASPASPRRRAPIWLAAASLFALSTSAALDRIGVAAPRPHWFEALETAAAPLRSINSYGLFAVMTTSRPEILLEGSYDGREWRSYEFQWKAGRLDRRPSFAGLHLPRLDWQLWFAALRGCEGAPWFHRLLARMLAGSREVAGLLRVDPFPGQPPRYLRSSLYAYEFDPSPGPNWWRRSFIGPYCATVTLRGEQLQRADLPLLPEPE